MYKKISLLFSILTLSIFEVLAQNNNDIYCFRIDTYKMFSKEDNKLTLLYSSILKGNITIRFVDGKYVILKSDASELMMNELPNEKILFYNIYDADKFKTIINNSDLEKDEFTISFESESTVIQYNFVRIRNEAGIYSQINSGTSFFIDSIHLLTNYHVVNGNGELKVYINNKTYNCKIEKYDSTIDLAVLKVLNFKSNSWAKFNTNEHEIGESCYAIGFPLSSIIGDDLKFTSGIISSLKGYRGHPNYLQITAPIDRGNSGGPLIDQAGNVIGVISAKLTIGTNIGYAIKTEVVKKIWDIFVSRDMIPKMTAQAIYKKNSKITFLIKNYIL